MFCKMLHRMFHILVLLRVLLVDGALTLSIGIDSQLVSSVEDCYERISIGEKLSIAAIYRNVSELTSRECELLCKQDEQCQIYVYGVGAKGNASCELSNLNEREVKDNHHLMRHPDYDVYIRRIQCEQSPPIPLQASLNDPPIDPAHRPIFRPEIDEPKRPAADFPDLRPFEINPEFYGPKKPNPYFSNHIVERPDGCEVAKPIFDHPPVYGEHIPQNAPFRPNSKPDPHNDVLQFQDQHGRPPLDFRPSHLPYENNIYGNNPTRPNRPVKLFPDEKPQYVYIQRPNKKPKPHEYSVYNKPDFYPPYNDFTYNQGDGPVRPPHRPYKPSRPNDYPSGPYAYQEQYASSYGGQYEDNYLDPFPPVRPYRPIRPINDRPVNGYEGNHYDYGTNYGYNQNFHSHNNYGTSDDLVSVLNNNITELNRPQRPLQNQVSIQSPQVFDHDGSHLEKPTNKPILYSNTGMHASYDGYGNSQSSYSNNQNYYNNKPHLYDTSDNVNYSGYASHFGNTSPQYGHSSSSNSQGYGNERPLNKPFESKPYPAYDDRPPKPSFNNPLYNRPLYNSYDPSSSYGSNPLFNHKPQNQPNDDKPVDYDRPDPNYDPPIFGSQDFGSDDEGYRNSKKPGKPTQSNNYKPTDIKPVYEYETDKPNNLPSFISRPGGQVVTSKPVAVGDYGSSGREPGFALTYKEIRPMELLGFNLRKVRAYVNRLRKHRKW